MKWVAFAAVVCLQLSTFACGLDAYTHQLDGCGAAVATERHSAPSHHQQKGMDHPCEVHAAHVFADIASAPVIEQHEPGRDWPPMRGMRLFSFPVSIEHPPTA